MFPEPLQLFLFHIIFFTVLISDILINPAGSFHTKLSPPAAHPQPKKDANVKKCILKSWIISLKWKTSSLSVHQSPEPPEEIRLWCSNRRRGLCGDKFWYAFIPHEVRISTKLFDQDIRRHQLSAEGFPLKTVSEIQERIKQEFLRDLWEIRFSVRRSKNRCWFQTKQIWSLIA